MAEKVIVKAEKRDERGKNVARRLRGLGRVPVIVYGGGGESLAASAALADLAAILRSDSGQNTVFSLDIAGVGESDVIFQDRQIDAIRGRLIHADLRRLVKGEKIEMTVPIHLVGEPIGVKDDGGMLEQQMREIKILCEPANAPDAIDVDVSGLHLNESVHVSDLTVGEGIEIQVAAEAVIASVVYVKEAVLEPQIEEGAQPVVEGEEGGAPAAAEPEAEGGE
jgi:large subunit ribosomal protein L25